MRKLRGFAKWGRAVGAVTMTLIVGLTMVGAPRCQRSFSFESPHNGEHYLQDHPVTFTETQVNAFPLKWEDEYDNGSGLVRETICVEQATNSCHLFYRSNLAVINYASTSHRIIASYEKGLYTYVAEATITIDPYCDDDADCVGMGNGPCQPGKCDLGTNLCIQDVLPDGTVCGGTGPADHQVCRHQECIDHPHEAWSDATGGEFTSILGEVWHGMDPNKPDTPAEPAWMLDYLEVSHLPINLFHGTDLGVSVEFGGRTIFYFGDTMGGDADTSACGGFPGRCNDIMGIANTPRPAAAPERLLVDILEIPHNTSATGKYKPITIPGIHDMPADNWVWDDDTTIDGGFNVPTGAIASRKYDEAPPPTVVFLWYGTGTYFEKILPFVDVVPSRSWLTYSTNGEDFQESCYFDSNGPVPFSGPPVGDSTVGNTKFVQVSAVEIDNADYLFEEEDVPGLPQTDDEKGYFLFGAGDPFGGSPLYLAYVPATELCPADGQKRIRYYTGSWDNWCGASEPSYWSPCESDAIGLAMTTSINFSEISVKLIMEGGLDRFIVMTRDMVGASVPKAEGPWDTWQSFGALPGYGYGPYILDRYVYVGGSELTFWTTSCVWNATNNTPYGVYAVKHEITF
ncbi:MAG: hypothetical protein C4523_06875 [Myxococcales bacterium]|nr:MAG: hypothetical protein C4523_06875 [Myxococcales bacterium]